MRNDDERRERVCGAPFGSAAPSDGHESERTLLRASHLTSSCQLPNGHEGEHANRIGTPVEMRWS